MGRGAIVFYFWTYALTCFNKYLHGVLLFCDLFIAENRFQSTFNNNSQSQNRTLNDNPTIHGYYSVSSSGPAKYAQKSPVSKTPDYLDFNSNEKISSRLRLIKADTGWVKSEQDTPETWTSRTDVTVPDEHAQRIQNLKRTCKEAMSVRQREQRKANLTEFFYSKDHKFAYCKVPKSGSTFWMKVFMVRFLCISSQ